MKFGDLFSSGYVRKLDGKLGAVVSVLAALFTCGVVYANVLALPDALAIGILFVCGIYAFLFLLIGATRQVSRKPTWLDWILCGASIACAIYFASIRGDLSSRINLLDPLTSWQLIFGILLLVLTIEATRRTTGFGLTGIILAFLAYNFWGHYLSGTLAHGEIDLLSLIDTLVYTTDGIFGIPIQVAASYVFLFVMFGSLLSRVGGSEFMYQVAAALTGRSPGGPAKIAVISSGLYGMISGSPTSDVATTGAITIPIMKRVGYSSRFAGAIEVAASTGGASLPPVMGSAAFIMVEYTGIDYRTIALTALIPGILYYIGVYVQVHYRAKVLGLGGIADADPILQTLKKGWVFIIPLIVITIALLLNYTPTYVAVFGTVALLVVSLFVKDTRPGPRTILYGLSETTTRMLSVSGACAAAGLVIGGLTMTGLAMKGSGIVMSVGEIHILLMLLVAALITILLGMGMPTPSAYILAAVILAPAFNAMNLAVLPSNMFLLYFSMMSALTPPVAVAAFAASAIANEDAMRIAVTSVRLAAAGFLLPFLFIWNNALLGYESSMLLIMLAVVAGVFGIWVISRALEENMSPARRILELAFGLLFFAPMPIVNVVALCVVGGIALYNRRRQEIKLRVG